MGNAGPEVARALRRQQRVDDVCVAAIRAASGVHDVAASGRRLYRGRVRLALRAPHLHPRHGVDDIGSFRGAADGVALRLRHSDGALHDHLCPADPVARLVFDLLEQYRVETLADPAMPGVAANLRHRHREWSLAFHRSGLTQSPRGLLLYTLSQVCRTRLTGEPVVPETEGLIENTRFWLAPALGDDLAGLRRSRTDQAAFAVHALSIAVAVAAIVDSLHETGGKGTEPGAEDEATGEFTLFEDDADDSEGGGGADALGGRTTIPGGTREGYRVFTTAYDDEREASSLLRPELLPSYRVQLDQEIARRGINVARVTRGILAHFAEPVRSGWDGGHEEGVVDGRVLARLVTSPGERRVFRVERVEPVPDTLVTFLVDCSGSMKQHAVSVATVVDVFARALDQAGASCEILGFTTAAWNGGRARREWMRSGRPKGPGRLNERRHLVFKDADTTWRRSRPAISALLYQDLYREGIDGEAVEWAAARSADRAERRKVLFVISDGSPMDGATAVANGPGYLDQHLRGVVAQVEERSEVDVVGIGVGLDLTSFYRRSVVLDLSEGPANATFTEILALGAEGRGR